MKPWQQKGWILPPEQNGDFVAQMEHVLDVYKRPYDPLRPVVCMEESPKPLIKETRTPLSALPGIPLKYDYEYERCGIVEIFMASEPLVGWRKVPVTEHRTKKDWAHFLKDLADQYPKAIKITLVQDNLNTHPPGALYETFSPAEAKKLWNRFEFIYTPKHGSWLNMAEIELHVLNGQCLNRRIGDIATIRREVEAWLKHRNTLQAPINWRFTTQDARIKLHRLYPTIEA